MTGARVSERPDLAKVYFDIRAKVFLVVAQAKMGVGTAEIGDPVSIPDSAEFESRIGPLILQFLDSFRTNVYSQETARRFTEEEYKLFRKRHLSVDVERLPSGDLVILPLHHEKGGYTGTLQEQIVVPKEEVPASIASALREAFGLAT